MHTAWSARRTCIASASAVEWTATVSIPISCAARWMRSAISPRLAMSRRDMPIGLGDHDQRLVELDGLRVFNEHRLDRARGGGGDRVHNFHRLDDDQRIAGVDRLADAD